MSPKKLTGDFGSQQSKKKTLSCLKAISGKYRKCFFFFFNFLSFSPSFMPTSSPEGFEVVHNPVKMEP